MLENDIMLVQKLTTLMHVWQWSTIHRPAFARFMKVLKFVKTKKIIHLYTGFLCFLDGLVTSFENFCNDKSVAKLLMTSLELEIRILPDACL